MAMTREEILKETAQDRKECIEEIKRLCRKLDKKMPPPDIARAKRSNR